MRQYDIIVHKSDWYDYKNCKKDYRRYVLMEANGLGCVFLTIYDDEDKVYLTDLQVDKSTRKQGLATSLINKSFEVINEDLDNFFKPIVCYVREDSPEWLYNFYKKMKLEVYNLLED